MKTLSKLKTETKVESLSTTRTMLRICEPNFENYLMIKLLPVLQKVAFIRSSKPIISIQDDNYIFKLFNSKTTDKEK